MDKEERIEQRMIFMCDLPIGDGSEFSELHPCLIASVDLRNECSPNIYIFPITHADKRNQPTHWKLYKNKYDFFTYDTNTVICEEGRSISKNRLQREVGQIDEEDFESILKCSNYIFYEKRDGLPFYRINIGSTFIYNKEVYIKIKINMANKCGAIKLNNCEYFEFDDEEFVTPSWSLAKTLKFKEEMILSKINKKST